MEAEFWRRKAATVGIQATESQNVLAFDCGGQQWVWETAMPIDIGATDSMIELDFVEKILEAVEHEGLPAPAPIEQRWTKASTSLMSPAGPMPNVVSNTSMIGTNAPVFSWVGIIMYIPTKDKEQRRAIGASFARFCDILQSVSRDMVASGVLPFDVQSHWAKLEVVGAPSSPSPSSSTDKGACLDGFIQQRAEDTRKENSKKLRGVEATRERIRQRYPVDQFNALRKRFDPRGILSNQNIRLWFE